VGGLHFDLQFKDLSANSNYKEKERVTQTENKPFVTSIQWSGVKFGNFSLKLYVGFQWPGHTKRTTDADTGGLDDTEKTWTNAEMDIKL
jgi:hypothetical protein